MSLWMRSETTRRQAVAGTAMVALMMSLAACGGGDGGPSGPGTEETELAVLEVYNPATNAWSTGAPMPTPRSVAAAAVINGKLYVAGGSDYKLSAQPRYDVLEMYDPATDSWTTLASMSVRREGAGAGAINGKMYVVGGATSRLQYHASMEIYDPATDTWTDGPSMTTARFGPVVEVFNGRLYVIGGLTQSGVDIATAEFFDPVSGSWVTATPMPTARGQAMGAALGDTLYVVGGFIDIDSVTDVTEGLRIAGTWVTGRAVMPTDRAEGEAAAIGDLVYVVGGLQQEGFSRLVLSTLEAYDPVADVWSTLASMPTARSEPAAGVIGDKLYVVGGYPQR